ncbi:MAG: shikimate kinase [Pseudomonadota bacterium]
MPYRLTKSIVFVGMMGAGKTAIGRALAEQLDVPFVDSDDEIEQAANLKISEIFEKFGEPFFREKEMQIVKRLVDGTLQVVATGGGAFCQADTQALIKDQATSIWLDADIETIWARVKGKSHRPLLLTKKPKKVLKTMMSERAVFYQQAEVHVKVGAENSIEVTTATVLKQLLKHGAIKETLA